VSIVFDPMCKRLNYFRCADGLLSLEWKVEAEWYAMTAKMVAVMRWYAQDAVNEGSEQNEVDKMKKGAGRVLQNIRFKIRLWL